MSELHEIHHSARPFRLTEGAGKGLELLNLLRREAGFLPREAHTDTIRLHRRIREALVIIKDNYKDRIEISKLARQLGMHPSYFTHLFKKETGMAPSQYILEVKLNKAKDFMLSLDLSSSAVAMELGFYDYAHFHRTFKAKTGMSPLEFVKKNKKRYDPR